MWVEDRIEHQLLRGGQLPPVCFQFDSLSKTSFHSSVERLANAWSGQGSSGEKAKVWIWL